MRHLREKNRARWCSCCVFALSSPTTFVDDAIPDSYGVNRSFVGLLKSREKSCSPSLHRGGRDGRIREGLSSVDSASLSINRFILPKKLPLTDSVQQHFFPAVYYSRNELSRNPKYETAKRRMTSLLNEHFSSPR